MPSPFPGMNPYLERRSACRSFHQNFLDAAQTALIEQVHPRYFVQLEATLYIHEPAAEERRLFGQADFGLTAKDPGGGSATIPHATSAPAYASLPTGVAVEEVYSLEIRDSEGNELVTVFELLSPTNKYAGPDREQYLGKRRHVFRSQTHLVEVDLLRGGPRMPLAGLPHSDYCAIVSRVEERPRVGVWPWRLRDPMPIVPVPLRASEPDAQLDLKAILDRLYDEKRYSDYIYAGPPEPRLAPDDAAWASQFVPLPS